MIRLRGITVDCADPDALAAFWAAALGYERRDLWDSYNGAKDPQRRDPNLTFQRTGAGNSNHLHLDAYADDPDAEAERLEALGAQRVGRFEEGDTWWWVLRDPAGNEFCIIAAQGAERLEAL
ncbi:MAG: VOC family protein, partial [Streptosporangiales bacterium]|nr:VOC family protein [Streptosporangiales bacterium]